MMMDYNDAVELAAAADGASRRGRPARCTGIMRPGAPTESARREVEGHRGQRRTSNLGRRTWPRHLFYAARPLDAWKPTHRGVFVLLAPTVGTWYPCSVRIFSRSTLVQFWRKHRDAEPALRLWFSQVEKAAWNGPADVRAMFGTADFIADNRIVFDIKGNTYRLIVKVRYAPLYLVFIRFIGTHAEYDRVDATKV